MKIFSNLMDKFYLNKNSYKFIVSGYSNDGLIEVVEGCKDIFQVGVQWHPERMLDYDVDSRKILENFVSS